MGGTTKEEGSAGPPQANIQAGRSRTQGLNVGEIKGTLVLSVPDLSVMTDVTRRI